MSMKQRRSEASKKAWRSRKRMRGKQSRVQSVVKTTTRADRIRGLLAEGKKVCDIAKIEGCNKAYVRVVRRRSEQPFCESANYKWRQANYERYRANDTERQRRKREEARANG